MYQNNSNLIDKTADHQSGSSQMLMQQDGTLACALLRQDSGHSWVILAVFGHVVLFVGNAEFLQIILLDTVWSRMFCQI